MPTSPTRSSRRYIWSSPSHRHAAPSAPWPWINLHDEVDPSALTPGAPPIPPLCDHENCGGCWRRYPRSRFPNWTDSQVRRSGIFKAIHHYRTDLTCSIYHVDVDKNGVFGKSGQRSVTEETVEEFWVEITKGVDRRQSVIYRPKDLRLRALFVDNMSGPVLQMLGAKYNIEPFFFSSSLNWIPSRFQEEVQEAKGDHITITLTFLRTKPFLESDSRSHTSSVLRRRFEAGEDILDEEDEVIVDTERPLLLEGEDRTEGSLVTDLLSVHLIRNVDGNTIISYHPAGDDSDATSAQDLHERIRLAGKSVYWQDIFQNTPDPTFILLVFLWYAMYAWDEALERLYNHICWIESKVMDRSEMHVTYFGRHLHVIRAHHLHYSSLLDDFRKSVDFIWNTPNPAMDSPSISEKDRFYSRILLGKECHNLKIEIERLEAMRSMQDNRLKNLMNVVFSTVNIADSKRMEELTEAAVRDSAAMKQIAYLSMIFLPPSLVAAVLGMNVKEINGSDDGEGPQGTLAIYFGTAVSLTVLTVWILMAVQSEHVFHDTNLVQKSTFWERLAWPMFLFRDGEKASGTSGSDSERGNETAEIGFDRERPG